MGLLAEQGAAADARAVEALLEQLALSLRNAESEWRVVAAATSALGLTGGSGALPVNHVVSALLAQLPGGGGGAEAGVASSAGSMPGHVRPLRLLCCVPGLPHVLLTAVENRP